MIRVISEAILYVASKRRSGPPHTFSLIVSLTAQDRLGAHRRSPLSLTSRNFVEKIKSTKHVHTIFLPHPTTTA